MGVRLYVLIALFTCLVQAKVLQKLPKHQVALNKTFGQPAMVKEPVVVLKRPEPLSSKITKATKSIE